MRKPLSATIAAVAMTLALALTGCGASAPQEQDVAPEEAPQGQEEAVVEEAEEEEVEYFAHWDPDAPAIIAIARHEGLWAHARSVELRQKQLQD